MTTLNFRLKQIYEYHVERCLIVRRASRKNNFNSITFHIFLIINDITAKKSNSQFRFKKKTDILKTQVCYCCYCFYLNCELERVRKTEMME